MKPTVSRTSSRWRALPAGPDGHIPTYCARKQGADKPEYIPPSSNRAWRETYGVSSYHEQVSAGGAYSRQG